MVPSIQRPLTNQRPNSTTRTTPKLTLMLLKKVVLPTCQLKRGPTHQTDAQPCTEWCLLSSTTKTAFHQMSMLVIAPDTIVHQHQLLTLLILMMTFVSSPTTYLCTSSHQTDLWRHLLLLTPQNYHKITTYTTKSPLTRVTDGNICRCM